MNNRYREEEQNEKDNVKDNTEEVKESIEEETKTVSENDVEVEEEIKESKKDKKLKKIYEEEINKLKEENKKLKDQYLRTLAETDNYRKRMEEEKIRDRKYSSQRLLEKLISFTDIFDKACNADYEDPVMKNFLMGFKMINDRIQGILEEEGVKKIKVEKMFNPKYEQAMETDYDETKEEGEILAVLREGYMYKDRVLVYTMVKVNKKPVENKENENKEN